MIRYLLLAVSGLLVALVDTPSSDDLFLQAAAEALQKRQTDQALNLIAKVINANPGNIRAFSLRAQVHASIDQNAAAAMDWGKVIELDAKLADAYQQRGMVHFKMGKIKESIADFDQYIALKPSARVSHWQRGISYYYAGRYDEGRRQFEGYQDFDDSDVENAVWRFMCMARMDGIDKARKALLKIGNDRRVPMRQVYDLFKGERTPGEVLAMAAADQPPMEKLQRQLFYAHLYVGIYHDLLGDKKKALEHLNQAAGQYRIGHYMGDVARIHRDLLARELSSGK